MHSVLGVPIVGGMNDSDIIDALGGTTEVARLCKVQPPSVSGWRNNGIPRARRQFLELLRPDVFSALPGAANDDAPPAKGNGAAGEAGR